MPRGCPHKCCARPFDHPAPHTAHCTLQDPDACSPQSHPRALPRPSPALRSPLCTVIAHPTTVPLSAAVTSHILVHSAMAMCLGDSLLLSPNGASRFSVVTVAAAVSHHGDQCRSAPRLAACRTVFGGLPSLIESRVVRNGSRKRLRAIRAAQSGSVDTPESSSPSPSPGSSPSTNTSSGSQAQSHLDLLERMTENSPASQGDDVMTIRDQLSSQVEPEAPEVVVSLANGEKDTPVAELTISQKRNIRRQNYLNKVSERNDAPFFATVAGFVLVPPILILGFAVATGYVELFP